MNRHNRFTPQWVFLLCGTLLVFIALFLVLPVAISAEDACSGFRRRGFLTAYKFAA